MKIINPSYEILNTINGEEMLRFIEKIGRVCYKSEDRITDDSAKSFVLALIKSGHESVLEHVSITVKFICDRGVSHEIVRHRLASYSQESTRYCNYGKANADGKYTGLTFIRPCYWPENSYDMDKWKKQMQAVELLYISYVNTGSTPEQARAILPNSLKTEIVMTANLREWRHFLKLRTARDAHPQIREIAVPLLKKMQNMIPVVFDDI